MKKLAFDNEYYLKIQREEINKRIALFGDKLYLEFGGKLFDDYHASRVLPGFKPDSKLKMLLGLKDKSEIVIVVNSNDINANKVRNDIGITYQAEVERLIDAFKEVGLYVSSVVLSFYQDSPLIDAFIHKLNNNNINTYKHYKINGYPQNIPLIVSEEGLGKNEYIKTSKPLVVITAPGPGSGKMATCLSQLYHDHKIGINAGYAKYETFPIWNLSLKHPVNLAYEAATVDLNDVNMIDPFHLEHYGLTAVNYNRDVEVFPLLNAIFKEIYGNCPYNSPTDMGVNMAGFAIKNNDVAIKASKDEIIRRYYQALKNNYYGKFNDECVLKEEMLMNQIGVSISERKCINACMNKANKENVICMAIELNNGSIITGKRSTLLSAPAALLLNALKKLAKIDDSLTLISPNVIEPIQKLKIGALNNRNPRLHAEEVLIALAIQATTNTLSEFALKQLSKLKGCQAHSSVILSEIDLNTFKKLGIDVTEEPNSYAKKLYQKY
ncbi:MAG: DUF1846 domain-containing protein [Erysipelotrichaceae bacterium]|nr:DUF1846 domain-containing protein [Erysipelotrichaceae bacterium]